MSSAAASLESLQYLLQYMDANRRFEISNRCPALRDFEKSVPLHIKSLVFRESCVFVNGTKYNLGIIRKYNVGEAPEYISDSNAGGGIPFEVDEYGYEDVSDYTTLTPGDLEICRRLTPRQENDDVNMRGPVETTLEASAPIVHESSFPLKKLEVNIRSADELTNPIVRTAEILKIRLIRRTNLRTISTITNPVVHIIVRDLSEQTLEEFVVNWIETERPIGFEYTIGLIIWEPCFEKEMEDVLKRLNGVPIDDDNVIIPMSDDTQLKISYGPFPEFAPHCNWAVKLVTEVIQHG
ncbi:unnamed protein product [Caenorhabditis brenneri]